jgi:hypothetical protein
VNLTADSPERARQTAIWAAERGIDYLDGAIMTPTSTMGGPAALVLYSGPQAVYETHQPALRSLGGTATYLGSDPGRAAAHDVALLDLFWTSMSGGFLTLCRDRSAFRPVGQGGLCGRGDLGSVEFENRQRDAGGGPLHRELERSRRRERPQPQVLVVLDSASRTTAASATGFEEDRADRLGPVAGQCSTVVAFAPSGKRTPNLRNSSGSPCRRRRRRWWWPMAASCMSDHCSSGMSARRRAPFTWRMQPVGWTVAWVRARTTCSFRTQNRPIGTTMPSVSSGGPHHGSRTCSGSSGSRDGGAGSKNAISRSIFGEYGIAADPARSRYSYATKY